MQIPLFCASKLVLKSRLDVIDHNIETGKQQNNRDFHFLKTKLTVLQLIVYILSDDALVVWIYVSKVCFIVKHIPSIYWRKWYKVIQTDYDWIVWNTLLVGPSSVWCSLVRFTSRTWKIFFHPYQRSTFPYQYHSSRSCMLHFLSLVFFVPPPGKWYSVEMNVGRVVRCVSGEVPSAWVNLIYTIDIQIRSLSVTTDRKPSGKPEVGPRTVNCTWENFFKGWRGWSTWKSDARLSRF